TTTYDYELTLSGDCEPVTTVRGSVTVDAGPIIKDDFIRDRRNQIITDVSCYGENTGSIVLGDPSDADFLNVIGNIALGVKQQSSVNFSVGLAGIRYDDIIRLTIEGTEYSVRCGELNGGVQVTYSQNNIMTDLVNQINTDSSQNYVDARQSGFGIILISKSEGDSFTVAANTNDTTAITAVVTTPVVAESYTPTFEWIDSEGNREYSINLLDKRAGEYVLNVTVNNCTASATFEITEPEELSFTTSLCGGEEPAISITAMGGTPPYTFELYETDENDQKTLIDRDSGSNPSALFNTGLFPGQLYTIAVSDSGCSPLTRSRVLPKTMAFEIDNVVVEPSYCASNSIPNGSIVTSRLIDTELVSAISGGSGLYSFEWTRSDTGSGVIYGTGADLNNVEPGFYHLTIRDELLGCVYRSYDNLDDGFPIEVGGPPPVSLDGVETPQFVDVRSNGNFTSTNTADFVYTLNCSDDENASFELIASGGYSSSVLQIQSINPPSLLPLSGPVVSISNLSPGLYVFEARDTNPPDGKDPCLAQLTVRVEAPVPYDIELVDSDVPLCPEDLALGGRLLFEVTGGSGLAAPYTVRLNGGLLVSNSAAGNTVEFTNIDVTNPALRTINSIEIIDYFGCSSGEINDISFTFDEVYQYEVNNLQVSDIDCSSDTSGLLSFTVDPSAVNPSAPVISSTNPAQVYISGASGNYELYKIIENPVAEIDNFTQTDSYTIMVSLNSNSICEVASQTFFIEEINNAQLRVLPPEVKLPGCGETESQIKLTIENWVSPLDIQWFEYSTTTSSSVATDGTTLAATTTTGWVTLGEDYRGLAVVNNLPSGIYRAIISDGRESACSGGEFVTRSIVISEGSLAINNFRTQENIPPIGDEDCKTYDAPRASNESINWDETANKYSHDIFFNANLNVSRSNNSTQTGSNGIKIRLIAPDQSNVALDRPDQLGSIVTPDVNEPGFYVSNKSSGFTYRIRNLPSGNYTLIVSENVGNDPNLTPCREAFFFNIQEYLPIEYTGDTVVMTDLCEEYGRIEGSAIGGEPFISSEGIPTYQFEWTYTPNDPTASSQVFYGATVDPAYPGQYCLRILDQNSYAYCSCDDPANTFEIVVEDVVPPFSVEGTLDDPDNLGSKVKSLPPDCSSGGVNGEIGIQIIGGQLPYIIEWFVEDPRSASGYSRLDDKYQNRTSLQDLLPGNYKFVINSQAQQNCEGTNRYTYYEEVIQVSPNRELYIMDGPYVDEDLCAGQQGRLILDIFDNNNGNLSFYYNNILIPSSDVVRLSDRSWSVAIVNAVDSAEFRIVNEEGCWISTEINRGIGEPNFSYSSPNYDVSSFVLAREEVTFENTSTDPFVMSEWIFGDNSQPQLVPTLIDSIIPVRHTYGVSGTYFTTLRIYNDIGCSEEFTVPITVGKGYNIMVPNVFTPNNDLINDNFRPLFNGFSSMTFSIYDYRGNVVYNEYVEELDLSNIQGITITGWDGSLAPYSPYFIYTASGVLLDGETEIEKSGTFILIN
ncbi:MAG: hypothetical protein ACPH63_03555, partial [Flavobacteriaceae bacterium]